MYVCVYKLIRQFWYVVRHLLEKSWTFFLLDRSWLIKYFFIEFYWILLKVFRLFIDLSLLKQYFVSMEIIFTTNENGWAISFGKYTERL